MAGYLWPRSLCPWCFGTLVADLVRTDEPVSFQLHTTFSIWYHMYLYIRYTCASQSRMKLFFSTPLLTSPVNIIWYEYNNFNFPRTGLRVVAQPTEHGGLPNQGIQGQPPIGEAGVICYLWNGTTPPFASSRSARTCKRSIKFAEYNQYDRLFWLL